MKYVFRALRGLLSMLSMGIMAYAAVGAAQERQAREAMPIRIGEVRVERTYLEDVRDYTTDMWADFFIEYWPEIVPAQVVYERRDPGSLDALKTRTRSTGHGLDQQGEALVSKF